ncbi:DUF4251 domain-containing protein [uncultured Polaribacter sp.]|uniref:DUF4251 domain-containing protein n=1 Tax=uncultured Polaribacter sp. TaxID=174711 RepID=UPI002621269D|nr:DUF4251 domain-containing protein [uncultured Polaribacter sp.]
MRIVTLVILVVFMSCSSSKNITTTAENNNLEEIVTKKEFAVSFDMANPLLLNNVIGIERLLPPGSNTASINLAGNPNHFNVQKDSLSLYIPYFGEQRIASGYSEDNSVKFEGTPTRVEQKYNSKKGAYILKYWTRSKAESYVFTLTLFANNSANLNVNSSHRSNINYLGKWEKLPTKEEI